VNRSRFGLEVVKAAIEVFGENVSVKVSPAGGYNDMGYTFRLGVVGRFFADLLGTNLKDATSGNPRYLSIFPFRG
jgi:2,4-dienoyl-CoA reductase-like NADH-dependent reductase (Old Yellow Enzyme family)